MPQQPLLTHFHLSWRPLPGCGFVQQIVLLTLARLAIKDTFRNTLLADLMVAWEPVFGALIIRFFLKGGTKDSEEVAALFLALANFDKFKINFDFSCSVIGWNITFGGSGP